MTSSQSSNPLTASSSASTHKASATDPSSINKISDVFQWKRSEDKYEIEYYNLEQSPSGKLVQIEHALTAVGSGQTSLGIKGNVAAPGFYFKLVRARVYRLCDLMGELVFLVFSVKYWFRFRQCSLPGLLPCTAVLIMIGSELLF
ncbi:hypothetical protein ACLB2K_022824 [Fragaria x ananassa]